MGFRNVYDDAARAALDRGLFVLCDRYSDATEAYQQVGRRLGLDMEGVGLPGHAAQFGKARVHGLGVEAVGMAPRDRGHE